MPEIFVIGFGYEDIFLIIAISSLLVSCAYRPLINPETSKDPATEENIAGNYWKETDEEFAKKISLTCGQ